jgi:glycolate oxidase iron-sulfur subunit
MLQMSRHILLPSLVRRGVIPFAPEIPDTPLRKTYQVFKTPKKRGRVAIFSGCSIDFLLPHLGHSLINVLRKIGYEVVLPKGMVCCGAPLRALGLNEEAAELAKKNLRVFSRLKVEAILSLCPTCTLTLKTDYPKLVGNGFEKAMDISAFLNDKLGVTDSMQKTSIYHDPCHLSFGLGVKKEPREIIKKAGIELVDSEDSGCCGFGGLFCLSYRDLSNNILMACTENIRQSEAEIVITSCPGCMFQLSQKITDRPVLHLIEVIEEAYCYRQ